MAWIEICGFTPDALGNDDPSSTYRSRASQVWPVGSQTDVAGESPTRAEPVMWNEFSTHCPAP
jgi:hypothetical protein